MIVEPLVPRYQALLVQYLAARDDLAREAALLAVDQLARELLPEQVSMDDMLALHGRAKARLAETWAAAPAGSAAHAGWARLARGDVMPVMLALLLPQQVEEHRQAERRWQAEHARLAAVFEQTDDLVLMFDAEGQIEYLNPAFVRATGWSLLAAQLHPGQVWTSDLPAEGTAHVEQIQRRVNGSEFTAQWSVSTVADADGRRLNHVCIGRDITRQRQVDDALQQNDRLRAVATLAAGIAHDFNNLLGSIQGLAEVCQALSEPDTPVARNLDGILRASERAAELVRQMLSFAREQTPQRQRVEVGEWLAGLQPLLAASLPKTVGLRIESARPLEAHLDTGQMEQVLLNLVKNAGYAMRARGGTVVLDAAPWQDEQAQGWLRIDVKDRGEGIAHDVLPRIFDPFFTTKPVGEGTGLGLAAAHGIVRQHQGELRVHSVPGQGTTFSVWLPAPVEANPLASAPLATAGTAPDGPPPPAAAPTDQARVASWYEVDADLRLTAVSPDWDAFAQANDGPGCLAAQVLGRDLREMVQGAANQAALVDLVTAVLASGEPRQQIYRCDSPTEHRVVEMCVAPAAAGRVRVSHRQVPEASRPRVTGLSR